MRIIKGDAVNRAKHNIIAPFIHISSSHTTIIKFYLSSRPSYIRLLKAKPFQMVMIFTALYNYTLVQCTRFYVGKKVLSLKSTSLFQLTGN